MNSIRALLTAASISSVLAPLGAFAADLPSKKAPPAAPVAADPCAALGPHFFALGESGFCARFGYDLLAGITKDFATTDIGMAAQRLPSEKYGFAASVPILMPYKRDVSSDTRDPYLSEDAQVNFMAVKPTDLGAFVAYVNLRAVGDLKSGSNGLSYQSDNTPYGSAWEGLVDQAWVRYVGFEFGIQPSLFGFSRWGYSIMPGYSSVVTTPALSYTYRANNIGGGNTSASVSFSVEDPLRRDMADGVLSNYAHPTAPDFVGQARLGSPNWLLHFSAALHQIRDDSAAYCCAASEHEAWGKAATVGAEYRIKWGDIFGSSAGGSYGRFLLQGAAADGATGYLGIPFFATDYTADADGSLHLTKGYSIVGSYEHLWTNTLKSSLTYSYFSTSQSSGQDLLLINPATPFSFDVKVHGSMLQAGIEDMIQPSLTVGLDAGYTWTTAKGDYTFGVPTTGGNVNVGFANLSLYVRKTF